MPSLVHVLAAVLVGCICACSASLSGVVTDPSGSVIVHAKVTIRNSATGIEQSAYSSDLGSYTFLDLTPGRYEISAIQPGFRPFREINLQIDTGASTTVNIELELGESSEVVTISSGGVLIETVSTQAGEVISGSKITAVPLNGRSFTDLLALQPGVTPSSSKQPNAVIMAGVTSAPPSGDLNPGNLSVSGQRETANGFFVNGSNVVESVNMGAGFIPNLDSIAEFRVLTNTLNAEYGNYSGGQILIVTRSGSNELHGSAFEFLRNTALDSRNFFSAERAKFNQNQFGGTLGGPLRHDSLFLFGDYQGSRLVQGVDTGIITVPSLANRAGNFQDSASQLNGTVNGPYWAQLLSQRLGYTVSPNEPYYSVSCSSPVQCVFPGAVIPQRAWSTPAKALLRYIPTPTIGLNEFSAASRNENLNDEKGAIRLDDSTRFGSVSAYYSLDDYTFNNPYPTGQGGANVPGFDALTAGRSQLVAVSNTSTFGSKAVNELHFSYLRLSANVGRPLGGVGPSLKSQGFVEGLNTPGIVPLAPQIEGIENVAFTDFTMGVDVTGLAQAQNTYQLADHYSRTIGTHILKSGVELRLDRVNNNPDTQSNGSFSFHGTETGIDFADFLLGIPSNYTQANSQAVYPRNRYIGVYAQDSWKIRPGIVLNYGLRWDLLPPWRDKFNQYQTFVLGQQSLVFPTAPTGIVFPGDPGIPSTLSPSRHTNFAPRIGLAYEGPAKTMIHAGWGMHYSAFEGLSAGIMTANPPYGFSYTSGAPPLFESPFITAATGQYVGQPFPVNFPRFGASPSHPDSSVDWSPFLPITGDPAFFSRNVTPYAEHYSLAIERQLGPDTAIRTSYVGTQAHHLLVVEEANPGNATLCVSLSRPDNVAPGTATCGPFGEGGTYITRAGQVIHGTRGPFDSNFGGFTLQKTIANSNYNALQVTIRHNSPRLELLLGYTYSKSIDQSSSLAEAVDPTNPGLYRAPSAFDLKHHFVATYRYQIPFDRLLSRWKRLSSGWELSGITRFGTGFPVSLFNNTDTSLLGTVPNGVNNNAVDTPNVTPGPLQLNRDPRNGRLAFNTSLFGLPALGRHGAADRRFFYGPGIENFDVALQKELKLAESKSLSFRLEAFNLLNRAQFYGAAAVNGDISSPDFGRIVGSAPPRLVQIAAKLHF